ncbi:MAG: hypothetical protein HOP36_02875 [Methyloglobulus sp.]|nr:hypothetical protein [Methyloglobulus sp.]
MRKTRQGKRNISQTNNNYRHPGMDCRNPETKEGVHADWMPSFPDGMTRNFVSKSQYIDKP